MLIWKKVNKLWYPKSRTGEMHKFLMDEFEKAHYPAIKGDRLYMGHPRHRHGVLIGHFVDVIELVEKGE